MTPDKMIISGGQTGVDRAALDFALNYNWPCGGYCPKGRMAEDGNIPAKYPLEELTTRSYRARTRKNVEISDGTLVLVWNNKMQRGTRLTVQHCEKISRPCFIYQLVDHHPRQLQQVQSWMKTHRIAILNVAGNRESDEPGIYRQSYQALRTIFNIP